MPLPDIIGLWRVGSEPELRFSPSGVAVCKFRAVASSAKKEEDGSWTTTGEIWVTCIAFHELAEHAVNSVVKGQQVRLSGRIQNREYDKDDGSKGYALEILLDTLNPVHVKDKPTQPPPAGRESDPPF